MDGRQQNINMTYIETDNKKEIKKTCKMQILHHNVRSSKNKLLELSVLLQTDLKMLIYYVSPSIG
jgi:hypothetical protein